MLLDQEGRISPFASTALPDDFHVFLDGLLADTARPTPADLGSMWELAAPDAAAPLPLDAGGRPVRVGCVIRDSQGTLGAVTHVACNVIVYRLLPGQSGTTAAQPFSAELSAADVTVLQDPAAAVVIAAGPRVA